MWDVLKNNENIKVSRRTADFSDQPDDEQRKIRICGTDQFPLLRDIGVGFEVSEMDTVLIRESIAELAKRFKP